MARRVDSDRPPGTNFKALTIVTREGRGTIIDPSYRQRILKRESGRVNYSNVYIARLGFGLGIDESRFPRPVEIIYR